MKYLSLVHEFVNKIPDNIEGGKIYISVGYGTAIHKCCCGCNNEVVTPLSPTGWKLIYDGETISLNPSIGNWGFPCQSHYWIENNKIVRARRWTKEEIEHGRSFERFEQREYFDVKNTKAGFSRKVKKWLKLNTNE